MKLANSFYSALSLGMCVDASPIPVPESDVMLRAILFNGQPIMFNGSYIRFTTSPP